MGRRCRFSERVVRERSKRSLNGIEDEDEDENDGAGHRTTLEAILRKTLCALQISPGI